MYLTVAYAVAGYNQDCIITGYGTCYFISRLTVDVKRSIARITRKSFDNKQALSINQSLYYREQVKLLR